MGVFRIRVVTESTLSAQYTQTGLTPNNVSKSKTSCIEQGDRRKGTDFKQLKFTNSKDKGTGKDVWRGCRKSGAGTGKEVIQPTTTFSNTEHCACVL